MVSEYTVDDLADESKDERRLEKAEWSAEKKVAKRKKKHTNPPTGKQNPHVMSAATTGMAGGPSGYLVPLDGWQLHCSGCQGPVLHVERWHIFGPIVLRLAVVLYWTRGSCVLFM